MRKIKACLYYYVIGFFCIGYADISNYEKDFIAINRWSNPFVCKGIKLYPKKKTYGEIRLVGYRVNLVTKKSTVRGTALLSKLPSAGIKIGAVPLGYQYRIYAYSVDEKGATDFQKILSARDYVGVDDISPDTCAQLSYEPLMFKYQLSPADKLAIFAIIAGAGIIAYKLYQKSGKQKTKIGPLLTVHPTPPLYQQG